jgi:transcriptional regulator with XRE-family HTH domain
MHKIKTIRKVLGLTQRQLAAELGLAKNGDVYIRKVENGRAEPSGLLMRAVEMLYQLKKQKKI